MSNVLKALARGGAAETDTNFKQTVLLLHGDGTNGAQNNTFLDGSTNNFTITRNGNTTQGTFSPFSVGAGEWSNYFDGSGDYLTVPNNTALDVSSGDFTVEAWFYTTSVATDRPIVFRFNGNTITRADLQYAIALRSNNTLRISPYSGTTIYDMEFTNVPINQWNHCALVRTGNNFYAYLNGVRNTTTQTITGSLNNGTWETWIGGYREGSTFFHQLGYISSVRVTKGTALYTGSTYTVPTTPLTAITNTSLLTCQSNRFVDNSTNAFAITRNGDVRVTPFSPFAPSAAYSAGTNGGSGYWDGTGDYLNFTGTNFDIGTGALTIEAWVYLNAYGFSGIISTWNSTNTGQGFSLTLDSSGKPEFNYGNGSAGQTVSVVASSAIPLNTWVHLAATKGAGSGGTMTLYVNGVSVGTPVTTTKSIDREAVVIGRYYQDLNLYYLNGYISNIRVSDTVRSISIPTAPYTSDANTLFLANFTNAGIIDNTGKNNLETVDNAQIDTTTKKYGTGSLEFDGTGDWLLLPASPDMAMGTGDFTFECWIYATAASDSPVYDSRSTNSNTNGFTVTAFSSTVIRVYTTAVLVTATVSNYLNTWVHVAFTRAGSTNRLFINGNLENTATASDNFSNQFAVVGGGRYGGGAGSTTITNSFTGFIDDLRITKGVARYTANFTAPTKEFPDQ